MAPPPQNIDLVEEYTLLRNTISSLHAFTEDFSVTPSPAALANALAALGSVSTASPLGPVAALAHVRSLIVPALNASALSGRYYGFVIGSTLPAAEAADNIVSALDQNAHIHLENHSVAAAVEDRALEMVRDLLGLRGAGWEGCGRVFTTGATASNILGLACAREGVVGRRLERKQNGVTVATAGLLPACLAAGISKIQILAGMPHSSIAKAASVLGLGTSSVVDVSVPGQPWRLDLGRVEEKLRLGDGQSTASIVVVGAGEVNTGRFATAGIDDMTSLRRICDKSGAWIHVDGAFGIFARILPDTAEFATLRRNVEGLELADSITIDGHKVLNVPYDTGIFYCRHPALQTLVFSNPGAAYLSAPDGSIPSFLNLGLENSRRFRALPVYVALAAYGSAGLQEMHVRMVRLSRAVAAWIRKSEAYELLPAETADGDSPGAGSDDVHIIVLFRARDEDLNGRLVDDINATRRLFVSGTSWGGRKATRIAVSSWRVDIESDFEAVVQVLGRVAAVGKGKDGR